MLYYIDIDISDFRQGVVEPAFQMMFQTPETEKYTLYKLTHCFVHYSTDLFIWQLQISSTPRLMHDFDM